MNFYKSSKISIFLITGILLACSPNKQQLVIKKHPLLNNSDSISKTNTQSKTTTQGLKVYIDPVTGKFLDAPPVGYVSPDKKTSQNTTNLNSNQISAPVYEEGESTTPGGGVYIKMPAP